MSFQLQFLFEKIKYYCTIWVNTYKENTIRVNGCEEYTISDVKALVIVVDGNFSICTNIFPAIGRLLFQSSSRTSAENKDFLLVTYRQFT